MKAFSIIVFVTVLSIVFWFGTGCSAPELQDGYQVGDATRITVRELLAIEAARADYCNQTKDSALRQAALAFIRHKVPAIPENGICDDLALPVYGHAENIIDAKARDSPD